jgi:hypothetical protein
VARGACRRTSNSARSLKHTISPPTHMQRLHKYEQLSALASDFLHVAITFGKIIISEKHLPSEAKTIKPAASLGGVAGGPKYVYHGIVFKFATDWQGLYRGDSNAMKAGANELRALMRYFGEQGLSVPLMALVDYRGYRLVAMSILPIVTVGDGSGRAPTLVYGSATAGRVMVNSDEDFAAAHAARGAQDQHQAALVRPRGRQRAAAVARRADRHRGPHRHRRQALRARLWHASFRRPTRPRCTTPTCTSTFGPSSSPRTPSRSRATCSRALAAPTTRRCTTARACRPPSTCSTSSCRVSPRKLDRRPLDALQLAQLTELLHRSGVNMRYLGVVAAPRQLAAPAPPAHARGARARRQERAARALARVELEPPLDRRRLVCRDWRSSSSICACARRRPTTSPPPRSGRRWRRRSSTTLSLPRRCRKIPSAALLRHVPLLVDRLCELTGVVMTREGAPSSWSERTYGLCRAWSPTARAASSSSSSSRWRRSRRRAGAERGGVSVRHARRPAPRGAGQAHECRQPRRGHRALDPRLPVAHGRQRHARSLRVAHRRAADGLGGVIAAVESAELDDLHARATRHRRQRRHRRLVVARRRGRRVVRRRTTRRRRAPARLFRLAMASFEAAVRSTPDMTRILNDYGGVLSAHGAAHHRPRLAGAL